MPRTRPSGPALRGPAIPASLSRVAVCSRIPGGAGAGNNGARKHVRPFSLLITAARAGIMCTVPAGGAGTGWMPHRGTAKISLKPAVGSVFPSQMGSCESSGGTPTWVVQSFREDSFSEANPALTSENPELSAEKTWSTASENRQSLCGQTRRRGRARASSHGEAGPLWFSCLSWPYPGCGSTGAWSSPPERSATRSPP
jgi:hypothetical protein